ncbi:hypothetical protein DLE60_14980 [Micromonospora globispora]|nr:hypothetical protein DLE60_14980 [Micromonospora globispora]
MRPAAGTSTSHGRPSRAPPAQLPSRDGGEHQRDPVSRHTMDALVIGAGGVVVVAVLAVDED